MKEPLVSVIIPAYNVAKTVDKAIRSVLDQTYRAVELIVVDDGSTDSTQDVCTRYGGDIRYIFQENQGVSAARNNGIQLAQGEYVCFLDADDWYLPTKLEKLTSLLEKYPEAGAATGAFVERSAQGDRVLPQPNLVFDDGSKEGLIDYFHCEAKDLWVVHSNTIVVRKSILDEVGGFNTDYRFGEDLDLWCRIGGRYSMAYWDEPVACYDRTSESSVCNASSVLDQGVEYLYDRRRENLYIMKDRRPSYRQFKNKILFARLMLSIYERNRAMVWACLRKFYPLPMNIRILVALLILPLPVSTWPNNKRT